MLSVFLSLAKPILPVNAGRIYVIHTYRRRNSKGANGPQSQPDDKVRLYANMEIGTSL